MKFFLLFFLTINVFPYVIPVKCNYKISEYTNAIKNYSNINYAIKILPDGNVTVSTNNNPLKVKAKYPYEIQDNRLLSIIEKNRKNSENLIQLAKKIKGKSKGYYQCVDDVFNFMSLNFKYSKIPNPPFEGDCNVAASTTVKILSLLGIPARIRYVIKFEKINSLIITGKSLHAIVEVYYPDCGWAFSDPLKYHHFVPSSYLLVQNTDNLLGVKIEKKKCLITKGFTDILKGKIIVYKIPNMFRFF